MPEGETDFRSLSQRKITGDVFRSPFVVNAAVATFTMVVNLPFIMGLSITNEVKKLRMKSTTSFRRYSEPCLSEMGDEVDSQRIPPLHDFVVANNHKNGTFAGDGIDCENNFAEGELDSEVVEEIDDEWFSKLANGSGTWSQRVPPFDGATGDGSNLTEIPLLFEGDLDFKERTIRTFRMGMRKIWKRGSATITEADPTNKVIYLGNVLTGWAKGEGCVEKPLHTIWKNYSSSTKPDLQMKITVTQSGLKAVTKDHGLMEYWSHRITYCSAPANLPRVFCWIYRHEGRKLKQELRCHAVLCSKESTAQRMASTLRLRLNQALSEFKRDKLLKQNARLSLVNCVYENPSLPRRKILLSVGSQNYKPPLERSKSAPKLMVIEESLEEEDTSPRSKRKPNERNDTKGFKTEKDVQESDSDIKQEIVNSDEKSDFRITNLNFVKKLCSSIENLVESTSNYSKKLLSERKSSKDNQTNTSKQDDSMPKKSNLCEKEELNGKKAKILKNVKFEEEETDLKMKEITAIEKREPEEGPTAKSRTEIVVEVKDHESDEGSNSLQSISSWGSDVSSLMTTSSEKSNYDAKPEETEGKDYFNEVHIYKTSMERLHNYLKSCSELYLDESKVLLHPTGEMDLGTTGSVEPFQMIRVDREETDSLLEEEGVQQEEEVVSDESGYVELTDHVVKRLSLDRKEKDIPYHQIIKFNLFRPRRFESSCLQV